MTDLMTQLRDYGRQIEADPILGADAPVVHIAPLPSQTRAGRGGLVWAVATFVIVLAVGGLSLALMGPTTPPAAPSPTVPYGLLNGEVTFAATLPWRPFNQDPTDMRLPDGRQLIRIVPDPMPTGASCETGPPPAGADALADRILADPDFDIIETVPVRISGIDGLQIDSLVLPSFDFCYGLWVTSEMVRAADTEWRMRLYLVDFPGESAQILTIAVIAPESDFVGVMEAATPIIESIEFHAP